MEYNYILLSFKSGVTGTEYQNNNGGHVNCGWYASDGSGIRGEIIIKVAI